MNQVIMKFTGIATAALMITGCTATGQQHRADVYKAGQTNTAQEAKIISIMAVSPAQIEVDNSEGKKNAQLAGAVLGALGGSAVGNKNQRKVGIGNGAAAGAAMGAAAGSMVADKVLVNGVSITYQLGNKIFTSAQVGRMCEFKAGRDAMLISTNATETRIQPNNECPKEAKQ
jgi:outer membrane lipoprotein SlyB